MRPLFLPLLPRSGEYFLNDLLHCYSSLLSALLRLFLVIQARRASATPTAAGLKRSQGCAKKRARILCAGSVSHGAKPCSAIVGSLLNWQRSHSTHIRLSGNPPPPLAPPPADGRNGLSDTSASSGACPTGAESFPGEGASLVRNGRSSNSPFNFGRAKESQPFRRLGAASLWRFLGQSLAVVARRRCLCELLHFGKLPKTPAKSVEICS